MSYQMVGLGAYTGFNAGPVGAEIVKRGGSTDSASIQAYATVAVGAGAAALCAAYGAGAASGLCAQVGSAVARIVLGNIGKPATAGNAYTLVDQWNEFIRPAASVAGAGQLAIRSYLVMRDQTIDDVAKGDSAKRAWADAELTKAGIPAAPILPQWAPRQDLWEAYKRIAIWAQNPIGNPFHIAYKNGANKNFCTWGGSEDAPWGYKSPSINTVAAAVKLSCAELLTLLYYPMGAMAAPGAPINFGMVGAYEMSAKGFPASIPKYPSGQLRVAQTPSNYQGNENLVTNVSPAAMAATYLFKLQEFAPELAKRASVSAVLHILALPPKPMSPVAKTAVVAGGAGLLWWLGKKLLF